MPLLDHFHPPLLGRPNPESVSAAWATMILLHLNQHALPDPFEAEQEVFAGPRVTIDLGAVEHGTNGFHPTPDQPSDYVPPPPVLADTASFATEGLFEVRVRRPDDGRIAAAIELVSRSNKDRPASRRGFAVKCASYLKAGASVVLVDIVTERKADMHSELADLLDLPAGLRWRSPTGLAAVSYRLAPTADTPRLEVWPVALAVGDELPTLPLWLTDELAVPLDLASTYEAAVGGHKGRRHQAPEATKAN